MQEDLRKWFSKTDPGGDWKRINSKGKAIGPCAREPGEPKPKCMSRAKRESLTKKERVSAVRAKRKHDPDPERKGSPINVSNFGKGKISENMENLNEKNVPTNPELWSRAKSLARSKFDVYPSAYANGWASKWYKGKGGSWKSVSEAKEVGDDPINDGTPPELRKRGNKTVITSDEIKEAVKDKLDIGEYDQEGDMAKSDLRSIMANAKKLHDMIEDADNLPEWCQNKITLAEDYISTVANYLTAEVNESDVYGKPTTAKTPTVTLKHKTSGKEIVVTKKSAPGYKRIGYYISEEFVKTGKVAKHNKTGEETHEYAKVDKEGRKTGEREYRNAQGKPMGEGLDENLDTIAKKHNMEFKRTTYGAGMKHSKHGEISINRYGEWHHKGTNKTGDSEDNFSSLDKHLSTLKEDYESPYDEPRVRYERPIERDSRLYKKPNAIQKGYNKTSTHEYFAGTYNRNVKKQKPNFEAVNYGNAYPGLGDDVVDKKKKLNPQPNLTMKPKRVKDFIDKTYKGYSEELEEAKVYDPFTKKMVPTKPIKIQAGGGATRNGVPVEKRTMSQVAGVLAAEETELDESLITGTKKISTHEAGQHKAEVRHSSEYNEFQVHYYKDGKHRGEGPVSYHENDRADATASAKREIERLGKTQKEEVEQIDELSKRTLARYAKRATSSMKMKQMAATHLRDKHRDASDKHQSGVFNRELGIKRAIDKLAGKYYHEDVEQIDELSKGLVARYANKVAKTTQANYDKSKDKFQFSSNRQDGMKNAVKRLTKEETQIDEISRDLADRYVSKVTQQQVQKQGMQPNMYDKLPKNRQQGVSNALKRTLVKSPVKEETVEEQLYKQGRFVTGAGKKPFKAPILATPKVEESKAHKVLNTFMKNREVAQRAFTGQNKPKGPDSIMARNKHINDLMKSQVKESRKAEIIKDIMKKKKSEKFEPDPVLSDTKSKSDLTA